MPRVVPAITSVLIVLLAVCDSSVAQKESVRSHKEQKQKKSPILSVTIEKNKTPLVRYTPEYSKELKEGEHFGLHILLTPANGQALNEEVASAGGELVLYRGPVEGQLGSFGALYKKRKFFGYRFCVEDADDDWLEKQTTIKFYLFGPSGASGPRLRWSRIGPKARVSAAIGAFKVIEGSYRFQRFLSPVSTAEFAPRK